MDPNANLKEQLDLAREIVAAVKENRRLAQGRIGGLALSLAERVIALHEWLDRGGYPPAIWSKPDTNDLNLDEAQEIEPCPMME